MPKPDRKKKGPSWAATVRPEDKKQWKQAREAGESDEGGGIPDIDDGTYFCRLSGSKVGTFPARPAKGKKKATPAVGWGSIRFTVARGEFKGTKLSLFLKFTGVNQKSKEFSAKQLHRLGYELPDPEDIPDLLAQIVKDFKKSKEFVEIAVKNDEYEGKRQLGVFVNDTLDPSRVPDDEDEDEEEVAQADDDEEEDEDAEESDESEEDEDSDEDEESDEDDESDDEESEEEDSGEEEDEEEDEDEEPARRTSRASKNGATKKKSPAKKKARSR